MKFFTMDWWAACQRGIPPDPSAPYLAHLDLIRDRLPADLVRINQEISLHDSVLRSLSMDAPRGELVLLFDGNQSEFEGGLRQFRLRYQGVASVLLTTDPTGGLIGCDWVLGELGYDELDILPSGLLQHWMLFRTGAELQVNFAGGSFAWTDIAD